MRVLMRPGQPLPPLGKEREALFCKDLPSAIDPLVFEQGLELEIFKRL